MKSTDPDNYHVLFHDCAKDGEGARIVTVLRFHTKPTGAVDSSEEAADHCEEEESAIGAAMIRAGAPCMSVTPQSAFSPTGRWFWNEPQIDIYDKHVVVTQSGGLDV